MSHRIQVVCDVKDLNLAKQTADALGYRYSVEKTVLLFKGGTLNNATLNTTTGKFYMDTDHQDEGAQHEFMQKYQSLKVIKDTLALGGMVLEQRLLASGDIEIYTQVRAL